MTILYILCKIDVKIFLNWFINENICW